MPAPHLIHLPIPFNELTMRTGDVHGWVVVLTIRPNMEVRPAHERNAIPSARLRTLNLGDRIWICGHSFNQNQYGVLVAVTTIIFNSPDVAPIFF
ncbi:hypothetical protein PGT21_034443 [Puccinia graminis f. sp. tritici]|uniref:Uncharacterized protein n=1 Tax=Puccinia graminis f. sp. tritici TaxID=56615 RepID=A0A5B0QCP6_PUCGR|nr:hypothetical protein PGT21_034443 [Puccinia graminis f. sp. tritici]